MCNAHSAGHAHGVRSDAEKAVADLRDDLIEELKLVTKYAAQIPVIASEDFPAVDEVVHALSHLRDDHKNAVQTLIKFISRLDAGQQGEQHTHEGHDVPAEAVHQH